MSGDNVDLVADFQIYYEEKRKTDEKIRSNNEYAAQSNAVVAPSEVEVDGVDGIMQ